MMPLEILSGQVQSLDFPGLHHGFGPLMQHAQLHLQAMLHKFGIQYDHTTQLGRIRSFVQLGGCVRQAPQFVIRDGTAADARFFEYAAQFAQPDGGFGYAHGFSIFGPYMDCRFVF